MKKEVCECKEKQKKALAGNNETFVIKHPGCWHRFVCPKHGSVRIWRAGTPLWKRPWKLVRKIRYHLYWKIMRKAV